MFLIRDSNSAVTKIFSKDVRERSYFALVGTLCSTSQPVRSESEILLLSYGKGEFAPGSSSGSPGVGHE